MQPRLLILCRYDGAEALAADRIAGRQMLWGLGERGIRWQLHQPWLPAPDLAGFDAVLCWSYRWHANNYIFHARAVTDRAAERGLPVVNPVERANAVHSHFLTTWTAAGIPCARCRRFARFDDFGLPYPLILRRDGVHMGEDVHLARTPEEARALIEERRQALLTAPRGERPGGPLDLAVEFIDTRDAQGIYRKWRSYVIGDRIIPRLLELSRHWLVNFGSLIEDAAAAEEDRAFVRDGEPNPELVRAAARLTGADIVALDYARRPDGGYVFWEANRHFLMLGDPGYERPERMQAATGRSDEEREAEDRAVGLAIADLVLERIAAAAC